MYFFCVVLQKQFYTINSAKVFVNYFQRNNRWFSINNILLNTSDASERAKNRLDSLCVNSRQLNSDIYILNCDGILHVHHGPFNRSEICREYNIGPRDLLKLDTDLYINVPVINVRHGKLICFSFRRHRGLIQSDRSIFFVPSNAKVPFEPLGIRKPMNGKRLLMLIIEMFDMFINYIINDIFQKIFEYFLKCHLNYVL